QQSNASLLRVVVPDRFANQLEGIFHFNQNAPADRRICSPKQLVRQNQKKQVRAAVTNEALKFCSAEKSVFQRRGFSQHPSISLVPDCIEIVRIVFGKK